MYPCTSVSPIRAKLCSLLADMVPGDINSFLFPSGGAESNEVALRAARVFTGRHKVHVVKSYGKANHKRKHNPAPRHTRLHAMRTKH